MWKWGGVEEFYSILFGVLGLLVLGWFIDGFEMGFAFTDWVGVSEVRHLQGHFVWHWGSAIHIRTQPGSCEH